MNPSPQTRNVVVLGSTGSIGCNTLEVIKQQPQLSVFGISGHKNVDLLLAQAHEHHPRRVVISDPAYRPSGTGIDGIKLHGVELQYGPNAMVELATHGEVEIVVAAIVGRAGLESSLAAVNSGKRLALANKETMVVAGELVTRAAKASGSQIIPVDSEHSAIFQCLQTGKNSEVERLVLTASGGPFREFSSEQMQCVSVEQALDHPTWQMGKKITIDSATMMNKALEIIEARWLFDVAPDRISVLIHPQCVIHSMVEFCDGSVISQMGPPDMKLPIQYSLTFPDRLPGKSPRMDWRQKETLELIPPDFQQFPALQLGFEVARAGGTAGAVLNAANEAAVAAFLNKQISFTDIVASCREILNYHQFEANPSIETLVQLDLWAREEIHKWIAC